MSSSRCLEISLSNQSGSSGEVSSLDVKEGFFPSISSKVQLHAMALDMN